MHEGFKHPCAFCDYQGTQGLNVTCVTMRENQDSVLKYTRSQNTKVESSLVFHVIMLQEQKKSLIHIVYPFMKGENTSVYLVITDQVQEVI